MTSKPKESELISAIRDGDLPEVERLLAAGEDANQRTPDGDSVLSYACSMGVEFLANGEVVRYDPNVRYQIALKLLDVGADPCLLRYDGSGPLFSALIVQDPRLTELLLSRGADPEKEHDNGEYLYPWASVDYWYEVWNLEYPEEMSDEESADVDKRLAFYNRIAEKYGKEPPHLLNLYRRAIRSKETFDEGIDLERQYMHVFWAYPEMPRPMPPEEFSKRIRKAIASKTPIEDDTPPGALT